MTAIQVEHLCKNFGTLKAVDDVTLSVNPKEIYAVIGPNGSGKTTLLKMIVGLLRPDKGQIKMVAGSVFGYISDNPTAYDYLTGREFLTMTAGLRGISKENTQTYIKESLKIFPINDVIDQLMGQYSRGNRQKVAYLAAIISRPKLLIIDEPIVGLDPDSINIFGRELQKFAHEGGAVLMATHILTFAQSYATKVGVLAKGRLVDEKAISSKFSLDQLYQLDTR